MNINLKNACERITSRDDNLMERWQWGQGVVLYALSEVCKKHPDATFMEYAKKWFDEQLEKEYPGRSINTTAPCLCALELYKTTNDKKYLDLCKDFADWCMAQAPRSEKGAWEHSCTDTTYPNQMWADTLFMGALFLAKYSLFTGERMYMHEALRQYALHYEFLKSYDNALIVHGYYGNEREQRGVIWGRGNGWFAAGSAIMMSLADESYPLYETVKNNFIAYIDNLVKFQNADGSWNTVIDDPDSFGEMTATSSFAFAINEGIKIGIIDKKYYDNGVKAYKILDSNVDGDGTILNASGGTCIMPDKSDYNAIGPCFSPFAQGLAILALNSFTA